MIDACAAVFETEEHKSANTDGAKFVWDNMVDAERSNALGETISDEIELYKNVGILSFGRNGSNGERKKLWVSTALSVLTKRWKLEGEGSFGSKRDSGGQRNMTR